MTSRASISSETRMAPISAVNPAPTLAAKAIPAMSGTTMRVSAKEATTPMKAWAPMPWSELKLSSPTSYPVAELRASPQGQKVSKLLPSENWRPAAICTKRSEMSWATITPRRLCMASRWAMLRPPPPTTKAPMPTVTLEISAMISPRCRSARGRLARARPKKANCS